MTEITASSVARERLVEKVRLAWRETERTGGDLQLALLRAITIGLAEAGLTVETPQEWRDRLDAEMRAEYDALGGGTGAARSVAKKYTLFPSDPLEIDRMRQHVYHVGRQLAKKLLKFKSTGT